MNFVAKKEIEVKISSSKVDFPRAGAFGSPGKVFFFSVGVRIKLANRIRFRSRVSPISGLPSFDERAKPTTTEVLNR